MNTKEITFIIEDDPEGGYTCKALGQSIFTEAETWEALQTNIREAVQCHFEPEDIPALIHLHYVKDEVIAV